jgi:hypothetical protein
MLEQVSFRDKIIALREEFINDRYNSTRTQDFWYVMDSIKDEDVILWAERAIKIKSNYVNESWNPREWEQCCNIIHFYKTCDRFKELPWTKAQKRFCTFQIIKFWDDLEIAHCFTY